jgi:hypothetical protein
MDVSGKPPRSRSLISHFRTRSAAAAAVLVVAAAPAIGQARAAPAAGTEAGTQERVLDVTLVPAAPAPRSEGVRRVGPAGSGRAGAAAAATGARSARTQSTGFGPWAWVAAAGAAALIGRFAWRRRRPRCPGCRAAMRRLGAEDAFAELDMGERTDHLVGDVRYAVWRCQACGAIEKRGTARDVQGLAAGAVAPPVGSAAFLRRRAQSGLSIWTPTPTSVPPPSSSFPKPTGRRPQR